MLSQDSSAFTSWHPGEVQAQRNRGFEVAIRDSFVSVLSYLPDQHRLFHSAKVSFLPVGWLDERGRPWASILTRDGEKGFVRSPDPQELVIEARLWEGDPLLERVGGLNGGGGGSVSVPMAGLGIEMETRRRNKFAGVVRRIHVNGPRDENVFTFDMEVSQALGNCPKYINIRSLSPHPTSPRVISQDLNFTSDQRLPPSVVSFVHSSDTIFLSTHYLSPSDPDRSYVGVNHRGGRKGFVRISKDGRTIVIPDYSGNRMLQSLGNIESDPLAGLVVPDFDNGRVLYLTGEARNLVGKEAEEIMPRIGALTLIEVTGYSFVDDALPVRSSGMDTVGVSPYSPPVRFLAWEKTSETRLGEVTAQLVHFHLEYPPPPPPPHAPDDPDGDRDRTRTTKLATLTFRTSAPIPYRAGQYAILDFTSFLRIGYQHMAADGMESTVNDDLVRTWTISSSPRRSPESSGSGSGSGRALSDEFSITMREMDRGLITTRLFSIARGLENARRDGRDIKVEDLDLKVPLVGIGGDFVLPEDSTSASSPSPSPKKTMILGIAGGVGITPFLSFIGSSVPAAGEAEGEVRDGLDLLLVVATREVDVMLRLIRRVLDDRLKGKSEDEGKGNPAESAKDLNARRLRLRVVFFDSSPTTTTKTTTAAVPGAESTDRSSGLEFEIVKGRLTKEALSLVLERDRERTETLKREAYMCGPPEFERTVLKVLGQLGVGGVGGKDVRRESFNY